MGTISDYPLSGNYVPPVSRITNITPFTYRDSATYLEILEELRRWCTDDLIRQVEANIDSLKKAYDGSAHDLYDDMVALAHKLEILPQDIDERFRAWDREAREQAHDYLLRLEAMQNKMLEEKSVRTFNFHSGLVEDLRTIHWDMQQYDSPDGLKAEHASMHLMKAEEWEKWIVIDLEKNFCRKNKWFDERHRYSPISGMLVTEREITDEIIEDLARWHADQNYSLKVEDMEKLKADDPINTDTLTINS